MRKTLITIFGTLLILGTSVAQEATYFEKPRKTKKELRKEKKAERNRSIAEKQAVGKELLESRDFVLLASTINGADGFTLPVRPTMNFVRVDSSRVTVQYGEPLRSGGSNGMGGFTFQGRIQNIMVSDKGEGKSYNVVVNFTSPQNAGVMSVNIFVWGDKAQARFFNGNRNVTFDGKYAKGSETKVWEAGIKNRN